MLLQAQVSHSPELGSFLKSIAAAQNTSLSAAFDDLLDRKISIPAGAREKASSSHNHLRDLLCEESKRDSTFPRVLSKIDSDFLGGSFARYTKIWPLDDIDIYFPLDGFDLFYVENGQQLPYTVQTDGALVSNPICSTRRWMNGSYVSSDKLISEFARVLSRHYPRETEVRPNGESVNVRMKHGASVNADGLGYDVVPCFSIRGHGSKFVDFYLIPNGVGGWIRTDPRLDNDVCDLLHSFHN
jgi:hypothetical protein